MARLWVVRGVQFGAGSLRLRVSREPRFTDRGPIEALRSPTTIRGAVRITGSVVWRFLFGLPLRINAVPR